MTAREEISLFEAVLRGHKLGAAATVEADDINEPVGWYSQINSVLLVIFILATVLFIGQAKLHVAEAKRALADAQRRLHHVMNTSTGELVRLQEKALIDLQRQRLVNALDSVENAARLHLGTGLYSQRTGESVTFNVGKVFNGDTIADPHFVDACKLAKRVLPDQGRMRADWRKEVLKMAGLHASTSSVTVHISFESNVVTQANDIWLNDQIRARTKSVYADSCGLQNAALQHLQLYYRKNKGRFGSTALDTLRKEITSAPPEKLVGLIEQFRTAVWNQAKAACERQGALLLNNV